MSYSYGHYCWVQCRVPGAHPTFLGQSFRTRVQSFILSCHIVSGLGLDRTCSASTAGPVCVSCRDYRRLDAWGHQGPICGPGEILSRRIDLERLQAHRPSVGFSAQRRRLANTSAFRRPFSISTCHVPSDDVTLMASFKGPGPNLFNSSPVLRRQSRRLPKAARQNRDDGDICLEGLSHGLFPISPVPATLPHGHTGF